jgi:hypothetical protein
MFAKATFDTKWSSYSGRRYISQLYLDSREKAIRHLMLKKARRKSTPNSSLTAATHLLSVSGKIGEVA